MLQSTERLPRRKPRNRRISRHELKLAIDGSSSVYEAAQRIGVWDSAIYKALRRYHRSNPRLWRKSWMFRVGRLRKLGLHSIIRKREDRIYVADLTGTEGTITCGYDRTVDSTRLKIQVGMTDRPWVAKFARVCGVGHPLRLEPKYQRQKVVYVSQLSGLRALLVLKDIIPFLMGGKSKEAKRAVKFFSPTGFRKSRFRAMEIWDPSVYPWKDNGERKSNRTRFL